MTQNQIQPQDQSKSISEILAERGKRYGSFMGNAKIAQHIKMGFWAQENYMNLAPDQQEALEMIAHKIARILNGDPNYVDNWIDIAGYAKLVSDRLTSEESVKQRLFSPLSTPVQSQTL